MQHKNRYMKGPELTKNKTFFKLITIVVMISFLCSNFAIADSCYFPDNKLATRSRWTTYGLDERYIDGFILATWTIEKEIEKLLGTGKIEKESFNKEILGIIDKINRDLEKFNMSIAIPVLAEREDAEVPFLESIEGLEYIKDVPYLIFRFGEAKQNHKELVVLFNVEDKIQERIGIKNQEDLDWLKIPRTEGVWIAGRELTQIVLDRHNYTQSSQGLTGNGDNTNTPLTESHGDIASMRSLKLKKGGLMTWKEEVIEGRDLLEVKRNALGMGYVEKLADISGKCIWIDRALLEKWSEFGFSSQNEFEGFLKGFFVQQFNNDKNIPKQNEIFIALLSRSNHLFEDCKINGFIGVNEQLFNKKISSPLRKKLLQLGLRHELRHENGIGNTEGEENNLLKEDVEYAKELGITSDELLIIDLIDNLSPLITNLRIRTKHWEEVIRENNLRGSKLKWLHDTKGLLSSDNEIVQIVEAEASQALMDMGLDPQKYVVIVSDSLDINARFYSENIVEMRWGMLQFLKTNNILDRDTIKFIMGHEAGHSLQRERMRDDDSGYTSLSSEYYADEQGLFVLDKGDGYNPYSPLVALRFMQALRKEQGTGRVQTYTHPLTHRRQVKLYNDIRFNYWRNLGVEPKGIDTDLSATQRTKRYYFDNDLYENISLNNIRRMLERIDTFHDIQRLIFLLNIALDFRTVLDDVSNSLPIEDRVIDGVVDDTLHERTSDDERLEWRFFIKKYLIDEGIDPISYLGGNDKIREIRRIVEKHYSDHSQELNEDIFRDFLYACLARIICNKAIEINNVELNWYERFYKAPFSIGSSIHGHEYSSLNFFKRKSAIFNRELPDFYDILSGRVIQVCPEINGLADDDRRKIINIFFAAGIKQLEPNFSLNENQTVFDGTEFQDPLEVFAIVLKYCWKYENDYLSYTSTMKWARVLKKYEENLYSGNVTTGCCYREFIGSLYQCLLYQIENKIGNYTYADIKKLDELDELYANVLEVNYVSLKESMSSESLSLFFRRLIKIICRDAIRNGDIEAFLTLSKELDFHAFSYEEIVGKVGAFLDRLQNQGSFERLLNYIIQEPGHSLRRHLEIVIKYVLDKWRIPPESLIAKLDTMTAGDFPLVVMKCYADLIDRVEDDDRKIQLINRYPKDYPREFGWRIENLGALETKIDCWEPLVDVLIKTLKNKGLGWKERFVYLIENGYLPTNLIGEEGSLDDWRDLLDLLWQRRDVYLKNGVSEDIYNDLVGYCAYKWLFALLKVHGDTSLLPVSSLEYFVSRMPDSYQDSRITHFLNRFDLTNLQESDYDIIFKLIKAMATPSQSSLSLGRVDYDDFKSATSPERQKYITEKSRYLPFYYRGLKTSFEERDFVEGFGEQIMNRWLADHNRDLQDPDWDLSDKVTLIVNCFPPRKSPYHDPRYRDSLLFDLVGTDVFNTDCNKLEQILNHLQKGPVRDVLAKRILLDKYNRGELDLSSYRKVKQVIEQYFPEDGTVRRELLNMFLQDVAMDIDELKEFQEESEIKLSTDRKRQMVHLALEYMADDLENKPVSDKKDFYEWLCGIQQEKPVLVQYYEYLFKADLSLLREYLQLEAPFSRYVFIGLLFVGPMGILSNTIERDNLLKDIFRAATGEEPDDNNILFIIFREIFNACPELKQLDLVASIYEHFISHGVGNDQGKNLLIKKLLMSFGVVGVKLGQVLSNKPELIKDKDLRKTLADCQDKVDPLPKPYLLNALLHDHEYEEIKNNVETVEELIGSASIKQGYAIRKADGSREVLKYIRPTAHYEVMENLQVLKKVFEALRSKIKVLERLSDVLIEEIEQAVKTELDLDTEVANQKEIRAYSHGTNRYGWELVVAKVDEELRGKQFFADEFRHGQPLREETMRQLCVREQAKNVSKLLLYTVLRQIFVLGKYHADLHPGNILVDLEHQKVSILDFGNCGSLSKRDQETLIKFLVSLKTGFISGIMNALEQLIADKSIWLTKRKILRVEIRKIVRDKRLKMSEQIKQIKDILDKNRISFGGQYEILFKFFETITYITDNLTNREIETIVLGVILERYRELVKDRLTRVVAPLRSRKKERRESENIACGNITSAGHKRLNKQLEKQFEMFAKAIGLTRDIKQNPLTEGEVDEALVKLGYVKDMESLRKLRFEIRHSANVPEDIGIFFTTPELGTELFWVKDPKTEEWTYAGGHYSKDYNRIHISLPIVLSRGVEAGAVIAKHDLNHIYNNNHDEYDEGMNLVRSIAQYEIALIKDVDNLKDLLNTLMIGDFTQNRIYKVKFDKTRLSDTQVSIISEYIEVLRKRVSNPDNIKLIPFTESQRDYIIQVEYCDLHGQVLGKGQINIEGEEELYNCSLRIIGMINIAFAVANIPNKLTDDQVEGYKPLIDFIQNQYKSITGDELTIPDSVEGMLKATRKIILPKPQKINLDEANRLNTLAIQLLTSA